MVSCDVIQSLTGLTTSKLHLETVGIDEELHVGGMGFAWPNGKYFSPVRDLLYMQNTMNPRGTAIFWRLSHRNALEKRVKEPKLWYKTQWEYTKPFAASNE